MNRMADSGLMGFNGPGNLPGGRSWVTGALGATARMPLGWYRSVTRALAPANPEGELLPDTSSVGTMNADLFTEISETFHVSQNAYKIHEDLTFMMDNGPLLAAIRDTITDTALGVDRGGVDGSNLPVRVSCPDNPEVEIICDAWFKRTGSYEDAPEIVRELLTYGSCFREAVFDPNLRMFVRMLPRPEHQMWQNMDDKGNLLPGYQQRGQHQVAGVSPVVYENWQIVQFTMGKKKPTGKGTGVFEPARRLFRKLQYLEEGMILARLVRAYAKMVHRVPIPFNKAQNADVVTTILKKYEENVERKRMSSLGDGSVRSQFSTKDVVTDFILPRIYHATPGSPTIDADVSVIEASNVQLSALDDILYLRDQVLALGRVPRRYLGIPDQSGSLTQGGLDAEDRQFARILKSVQNSYIAGIRKILNYELACHGINPQEVAYEIIMPEITVVDRMAEAQIKQTQATVLMTLAQTIDMMPAELLDILFPMVFDRLEGSDVEDLLETVRGLKAREEVERKEAEAMALETGQEPPALSAAPQSIGSFIPRTVFGRGKPLLQQTIAGRRESA